MRRFHFALTLLALAVGTSASAYSGQQPIHFFTGTPDGAYPSAAVVVDGATGIIYGVTINGGANGLGTVFQLTPPKAGATAWPETVIYSFKGAGEGQAPNSLVEDPQTGDLYGSTMYASSGNGVIFKLSKASSGAGWTETVIYTCEPTICLDFDGDLLMDSAGNLYSTVQGGAAVVELSPTDATASAWTSTVLLAGPCANNVSCVESSAHDLYPAPGLTMDSSTGSLYGSNPGGGAGAPDRYGSVFQLAAPAPGMTVWSYNTIHNFDPPNDGRYPWGRLVLHDGSIYGTTLLGGPVGSSSATSLFYGTVYEILPPIRPGAAWAETLIHGFQLGNNQIDGTLPRGGLTVINGMLYGTTDGGGVEGFGTIFMAAPRGPGGAWVEAKLYDFQGGSTDGAFPATPLTAAPSAVSGGMVTFYGTTAYGGINNYGTVFQATFPTAPPASGYAAICNVTCFENSLRWAAPPLWILGPEAVALEGFVTQVSDDGTRVELQARLLPGLRQPPIGLGEPLKITFDRRMPLKVGQPLYVAAKGPASALDSHIELLGVWPIAPRPSRAPQ